MELIIDTETTGLTHLSFANQVNYKRWPRMVQIAWVLVCENNIETYNTAIIRPVGFEIPQKSTQIHGITQGQAVREGTNLKDQLETLNLVMNRADTIVAHNLNFDLGILQSEALRINYPLQIPNRRRCTVHMGQAYLKKKTKKQLVDFPKLGDLHEELFGFDYQPKHDAQTDVIACLHVYERLKKLGFSK